MGTLSWYIVEVAASRRSLFLDWRNPIKVGWLKFRSLKEGRYSPVWTLTAWLGWGLVSELRGAAHEAAPQTFEKSVLANQCGCHCRGAPDWFCECWINWKQRLLSKGSAPARDEVFQKCTGQPQKGSKCLRPRPASAVSLVPLTQSHTGDPRGGVWLQLSPASQSTVRGKVERQCLSQWHCKLFKNKN